MRLRGVPRFHPLPFSMDVLAALVLAALAATVGYAGARFTRTGSAEQRFAAAAHSVCAAEYTVLRRAWPTPT